VVPSSIAALLQPAIEAIPVATTGVASGWNAMSMPRTRQELVYECLVDGRRAKHGMPFSVEDLTAAAGLLSDELHRSGWHQWARLITDEGDPAAPVFDRSFQGVEAVRRFGPLRGNHLLEILVVSSGTYWLPWQTTDVERA
jgi:hypothetical protein